jgi:hypothetical protein
MRKAQRPTFRKDDGLHETVHEHPAFGTITLSRTTGGHEAMFGSDIDHNSRMNISIQTADLCRDLSRDWIHSRKTILEFSMSHSQFAEFITSQGNGSGTPITLSVVPKYSELEMVPAIERIETKNETYRNEIKKNANDALDKIQDISDEIAELIDTSTGSISKVKLRELQRKLRQEAYGLGGTMEFVVSSAEEALEKATTNAKQEVEAFIDMTASQLGFDTLDQLAEEAQLRLEDKSN